jgi:hypothetical protein
MRTKPLRIPGVVPQNKGKLTKVFASFFKKKFFFEKKNQTTFIHLACDEASRCRG